MSKKLPSWTKEIVKDWITYIEEIGDTTEFNERVTKFIYKFPDFGDFFIEKIIGELSETDEHVKMQTDFIKKTSHELAKKAEFHMKNKFHHNYSFGVVMLWSALESLVMEILEELLKQDKALYSANEIHNTKILLGEFVKLTEEERARFILKRLEEDHCRGTGIDRYIKLLGIFKIKISIGIRAKNQLFELHNIRNVIVHKRGIADQRLVESCPGKKFKKGKQIKISSADFHKYTKAVLQFATSLLNNLAK
jgi:hypothetical protein